MRAPRVDRVCHRQQLGRAARLGGDAAAAECARAADAELGIARRLAPWAELALVDGLAALGRLGRHLDDLGAGDDGVGADELAVGRVAAAGAGFHHDPAFCAVRARRPPRAAAAGRRKADPAVVEHTGLRWLRTAAAVAEADLDVAAVAAAPAGALVVGAAKTCCIAAAATGQRVHEVERVDDLVVPSRIEQTTACSAAPARVHNGRCDVAAVAVPNAQAPAGLAVDGDVRVARRRAAGVGPGHDRAAISARRWPDVGVGVDRHRRLLAAVDERGIQVAAVARHREHRAGARHRAAVDHLARQVANQPAAPAIAGAVAAVARAQRGLGHPFERMAVTDLPQHVTAPAAVAQPDVADTPAPGVDDAVDGGQVDRSGEPQPARRSALAGFEHQLRRQHERELRIVDLDAAALAAAAEEEQGAAQHRVAVAVAIDSALHVDHLRAQHHIAAASAVGCTLALGAGDDERGARHAAAGLETRFGTQVQVAVAGADKQVFLRPRRVCVGAPHPAAARGLARGDRLAGKNLHAAADHEVAVFDDELERFAAAVRGRHDHQGAVDARCVGDHQAVGADAFFAARRNVQRLAFDDDERVVGCTIGAAAARAEQQQCGQQQQRSQPAGDVKPQRHGGLTPCRSTGRAPRPR